MNPSVSSESVNLALLIGFVVIVTLAATYVKWPARCCRLNFIGESIPVVYGVVPALALSTLMILEHPTGWSACMLVGGYCLVGLLDDMFGSGAYRGIRGHLTALRGGVVTTGLIKLVASPVMAAIYAMFTFGMDNWKAYVYITMIAASSNVFNLLDLRPGRSQGFAILVLLAVLPFIPTSLVLAAVLILAITIIPDARARVMIGDAGAIAIGCTLALVVIASSNMTLCAAYTVITVGINLVAEKYSLGKLITGNHVLRKLDGLMGRRS